MDESSNVQRGKKRKYESIYESLDARRVQDRKRVESRVNIGDNMTEWLEIKEKLGCLTHAAVAKVLLSSYKCIQVTSTPKLGAPAQPSTLNLSGIYGASMRSSVCPDDKGITSPLNSPGSTTLTALESIDHSMFTSTFDITDPLGIQITAKGDLTWSPTMDAFSTSDSGSDSEYDCCDYNYESGEESSCSDHEEDNESLSLITEGDLVFDTVENEDSETAKSDSEDESESMDDTCPLKQTPEPLSSQSVVRDAKCIAFSSSLQLLAQTKVPSVCPKKNCSKRVTSSTTQKASALWIIWTCEGGHKVHKWSSQPYLSAKGTSAGDFLLATNILVSGNNYQKIALLFKFMNIGIISRTTFDRVQKEFCFPAIKALWKDTLEATWEKLRVKGNVVLAGDGRNDSPGFSAMYCTYTLMDHDTKEIVYMEIVDKRQTGGNSPVMEREALRTALSEIKKKKIPVVELVTDGNTSVAAMMRDKFSDIKHQFDLWHGSKNLRKKIQAISKEKGNAALQPWAKKITNHFWKCAELAETDLQLMGMWVGLLHHVVDSHEWVDLINSGVTGCRHDATEGEDEDRDAPWLEPDSKAHQSLQAVVLEKKLLNTLKYYVNFRHTGFLETFNSHILMYSGKRFAFTWPSYEARNILAALDWQAHVDRPVKLDKNGAPVFKRRYSKNSKRWTVSKAKVPKTYPHIPGLLQDIVQRRLNSKGSVSKVDLDSKDPRLIQKSIAPIPAPTTEYLVEEHHSRFHSES